MKKILTVLICAIILFAKPQYVFSQDRAWDLREDRGFRASVVPGLIAGGEILLKNALLLSFNTWVVGFHWSMATAESLQRNLTWPWRWSWEHDVDGFIVNNFMHPYQGAFYFNAARANGFGFYQSFFFNVFGSYTWEVFCENHIASLNDAITTTIGAMALGEILFRLYAEAYLAGVPAPLRFLINPMAGFHSLVTGWAPAKTQRSIYEFRFRLGGGFGQTDYSIWSGQELLFSFRGPFASTGISIVYGNPFQQHTRVPFRHFEFDLSLGMTPLRFMDLRLLSDGYLFSFSPVYTERSAMSTGLSLHLDAVSMGEISIHDSTINQFSSALNWTVKYRHQFSPATVFRTRLHAGFTFLGVSSYHRPVMGNYPPKNYGYGFNSKLFFDFENRRLGRFEANALFYAKRTFPPAMNRNIAGSQDYPQGNVLWLFTDQTYSRLITERMSLGIRNSLAFERGRFEGFPDTRKFGHTLKTFVAWNL